MNVFSRMCCVSLAGMVLLWGMSTAGADEDKTQGDSKSVISKTRQRIVETLLDVVRDVEESAEVRASAARSLGERASEMEGDKEDVRETLLGIIETKDVESELQLAAIEALRESDVELTDDHLGLIGETLWGVIEYKNTNGSKRWLGPGAVLEYNRYQSEQTWLPAPDNVAGVQALLGMVLADGVVSYRGNNYSGNKIAMSALESLNDSEAGIQVLIETLDSLEMESPENISKERILRSFGSYNPENLPERREKLAERTFEEKHKTLANLLGNAVPKTEGIVQVLLKGVSHENPDVRAAAIEALGNEIPISDEGARPAESASPAAPAGSS